LIKRSSKAYIDNLLNQNQNWKILDIGCGYTAHKNATVVCDVQDLSSHYKTKKFIQLNNKNLPFTDKEFDFVIASHVIEHVEDVDFFISELERVSSKGYIELPTILEDNLVFENKKDHLWHMDFDDVNFNIIISKKVQYIEPVLTVSSMKKFDELFRKSFVLELLWQDKINYILDEESNLNFTKSSLLSLLRKYISKKIRMLIK